MHSIGRDNEGGYIVKLTQDEMSAFLKLAHVVEGKTSYEQIASTLVNESFPQVDTALGCITAYACNVRMLNDAKASIEQAIARFSSAADGGEL